MLIPPENPTHAADAIAALERAQERVATSGGQGPDAWARAMVALAADLTDVVVTVRRLHEHEQVWPELLGGIRGLGAAASTAEITDRTDRGRTDTRALFLLVDIVLDDAVRSLRMRGAPKKRTSDLYQLVTHLESGGAAWSAPFAPLTAQLVGLQYSLGYFRDKFIAHREPVPVGAIFLPDGRIRLALVGGVKDDEARARGGREVSRVLDGRAPDDPLDPVYDIRLDLAFMTMRSATKEQRHEISQLLLEFGTVSPDPYEAAVAVAEAVVAIVESAAGVSLTDADA